MRDNFPDDYVELIFYFDGEKVFDSVHIYTNNFFSRDVKVNTRDESVSNCYVEVFI